MYRHIGEKCGLTVARIATVAVGNPGSGKPEGHDDAEDLREAFEERAGILEYDADLPRPEAELEAARITATLARNRGYAWATLAGYPACRERRQQAVRLCVR